MAVKKVKKERVASSKDINDHLTGETQVKVINSVDSASKVHDYDVKQGEVHSDIHLEEDTGHGKSIVIRSFDFKANPQAFKDRTPSKQELFNAHAKQIEILLWKDGLNVMPDVKPQLILSKQRNHYRIVVGAEPRKGQIILPSDQNKHQTLAQAAHGRYTGT
jgi:hypothetical protein